MLATHPSTPPEDTPPRALLGQALLVGAVVLAASALGILTRPLGFLAAFWPANALLLGLFLRRPELASGPGWFSAGVAFFAADLMFGGQWLVTLWLGAANLTGVAAGYLLADHYRDRLADLRRPSSILYLFLVSAAAAATAAVLGSGATPVMFGGNRLLGLALWFTAELMSYMLILPVMLTMPRLSWPLVKRRRARRPPWQLLRQALPAIALAISIALGIQLTGPGAILLPVPALLWCSLTYRLFPATVLTLLTCMLLAVALPKGWSALPQLDHPLLDVISVRLGILLLALTPLTVAATSALREDLMQSLSLAVSRDPLTQTLSRRVFIERATAALKAARHDPQPCHLLLIRVENLKQINATHGHATGDLVLSHAAQVLLGGLRQKDLLGRLSGTVFALLQPDLPRSSARLICQRLDEQLAQLTFPTETGPPLGIDVSWASQSQDAGGGASLNDLLIRASQKLDDGKGGAASPGPLRRSAGR